MISFTVHVQYIMSIWCDVFKLLYLSIHLYISLTEWYIDSCSNKAFHSKMLLLFVTFYETPCIGYIYVLYVSIDQDISGLMMNILIMQTIRPIIAFYFIFLFMLIRHSSSNKMNTQGHPDLFSTQTNFLAQYTFCTFNFWYIITYDEIDL